MSLRTYYDPLHHGITLNSQDPAEKMVMALIDSPAFQRLRRIRQLGPAFLTFHGAESSRFTHSLGVFYLAKRALQQLVKLDKNLIEYKGILYASALLHDLGHSPLSHTGEEIFGFRHEDWSAKIIKEDPSINLPLEEYSKGTAEIVADILGNNYCKNNAIKALISSQLDCDRLDYLMRDSYSTGASYGRLDLERILSALTITPDGNLSIHPKGIIAVEHYLVVRNIMYRSVYNHRLNEVCNWLLEKIINTAKGLGEKKIWADKFISKWLWQSKSLSLSDFLANDDLRTGYHLIRWKEDSPNELAALCKRFIDRDLLKAISIDNLSNLNQLELLAIARKLTEKLGLDPDFCCGLRYPKIDGYKPYQSGLRIWDGSELLALENSSPLVKSLINPPKSAWLIHPKEINKELKAELKNNENSRFQN